MYWINYFFRIKPVSLVASCELDSAPGMHTPSTQLTAWDAFSCPTIQATSVQTLFKDRTVVAPFKAVPRPRCARENANATLPWSSIIGGEDQIMFADQGSSWSYRSRRYSLDYTIVIGSCGCNQWSQWLLSYYPIFISLVWYLISTLNENCCTHSLEQIIRTIIYMSYILLHSSIIVRNNFICDVIVSIVARYWTNLFLLMATNHSGRSTFKSI
jgi:hypothetical protein